MSTNDRNMIHHSLECFHISNTKIYSIVLTWYNMDYYMTQYSVSNGR